MSKEKIRVIVRGRVQGVFFRASTVDIARGLGLKGWVRNREDGTVEIMAEGDKDQLQELVEWCKEGPQNAHVTGVEVDYDELGGTYNNFTIKNS